MENEDTRIEIVSVVVVVEFVRVGGGVSQNGLLVVLVITQIQDST